jgi:hypothetical protein
MFNLQQRSEENANTQRTVVMLTKDYGMFKHIRGNRELRESNIQSIANQLLQRGQQQPIIVNERNEVIDGQHRLEACKRLKMPVQYIKRLGANLDDVISTNIVGKKWALDDYINRFAAEGNKDYVELQKFLTKARELGFATSVAIKIAKGAITASRYVMCSDGVVRRAGGNMSKSLKVLYMVGDDIKLGKFVMPNKEEAENRLEKILLFKEWDFYKKSSFVSAMLQCMRIKDLQVDRLLESARKYPRKWSNEASTENFVKMFEEVYNWRRKNKLPIVNNPERRK